MPPWAAFECDRTGWTFDMIPTEAPASAAARAARWPARPAPMTRTSCSGIPRAILWNPLRGPASTRAGGRTRGPLRLMDRMDAKLAKDLPDRRVAELAGRQHGVVARRQLISMGIGRGAIEARVCAGRLIRVHAACSRWGTRASRTWSLH